ncbi:ABC transporter substrate-binding protein [Microbacteriaceae bacterium K1510]|nr:ABC transporter substrate-binding protein [Microbacteriaceae bacterium K1510]
MKVHAAIAQALVDHDVDTMFGLVGDANLFMVDSFTRNHNGRFISAANEAGATLMAIGYATISGKPGIVTTTHGPALVNTLTALVEGVRSSTPVVLLCGDTAVANLKSAQKIPQRELIVATGAGFEQLRAPATLAEDIATAFRRAVVERRPIALNIPIDFQWQDVDYQAAPVAEALIKRGKKNWFFISADYTFGANLQDEATKALERAGGKVVGSVRHPLNTNDFSSFLLQAQASKADVVAFANGGGDTARAVKQAHEFGITKAQTIVGLNLLINEVHALGLPSTQGLLVSLPFYWDLNDKTRAFAKRWSEKMKGKMPSMMQAGVYSSVLHYLKALDKVGSPNDGAAVVAKMKEIPIDDPLFGHGSIRSDGRALHDVYVFQVKSPSESKGPWDYFRLFETVSGDKAFKTLEEGGCTMATK